MMSMQKIKKIVWDESYSVCDRKIDQQHRKVIDYINELIDVSKVSVRSEQFHSLITKIVDYASLHLDYEEMLLSQTEFDDIENHIKLHDEFRIKVAELAFDTMNGDESVVENTLIYLCNWWVDHILKEDKKYKPWLCTEQSD